MLTRRERQTVRLPSQRDLLHTCDKAIAEGNPDFIAKALPKLKRYVALYQERSYQLAQVQQRARELIEQHKPAAMERIEK